MVVHINFALLIMSTTQQHIPNCYHCGDPCSVEIIEAHDHSFCCEGCKTVFELLSENELCSYYDIEKNPGIKIKASSKQKFAYLENDEIIQALSDFREGGMCKVTFYIPQMHCSSCIWLLENLHRLAEGVINSQVHFLKKEMYVNFYEDKISLRKLVELLTSIGYEPSITLESSEKKEANPHRSLYYKLGIAGFSFGNIMLLSFPEYLDAGNFLEEEYKMLFGYLNLVLAIPVFVYSASDYYVSAYKALRARFINIDLPVSVGIFALFARSSYEIISGYGPGFMDSFAMFVFLLLVGKWYQDRTYRALSFERDYKSYFPIAVTRLDDNTEVSVPINQIQRNDVILVRKGEIIPADSSLLSNDAYIDYSFVTGESNAVHKKRGDVIFAGGKQTESSIKLRVEKEVSQSYLTRLWNQDAFGRDKTRMNRVLDTVSRNFTLMVMLIGSVSFLFWVPTGFGMAVHVLTSILIVACPCALALTVPFTFGTAVGLYGKRSFYLKNTDAIERMAAVNTLVFDKTGTLTDSQNQDVSYSGKPLSSTEKQLVKSLAHQSAHPISIALSKSIDAIPLSVSNFSEEAGKGISGNIKEMHVRVGNAKWANAPSDLDIPVLKTLTHVEINGEYKGYFSFQKMYRKGLEDVIQSLRKNNELYLLSGDNEAEFSRLQPLFQSGEHLKFNQNPEDKLNFIKHLQSQGKNVLMIGDGLNDAGALKQANVGISIADDVYQFSPACDAILDAEEFNRLPSLIQYSKSALSIVKSSFILSIAYNTTGIVFAVQGLLTPLFAAVLMPLSSITVVGFVTIMTHYKARQILLKDSNKNKQTLYR